MSDFAVPSYRVRPQRTGFRVPWRMVALSGAVLGAAAAGGAAVWGISRAVNRTVPVIEADTRPIRVKPSDPGGMRVANQDERIFESQRRGTPGAPAQPRLSPEPERPDVAALRQAASRPPPAPQPEAPPPRAPLVNPSLGPQAAAPPAASAPSPALTAPASPQPASPQPGALPAGAPQPGPSPVGASQPAQAATATPAITPPPMPTGGPAIRTGRAVVQLGALASEEAARAEWAKLQARLPELAGRQPQITRVDRGDQPPLWRIRATNMPDAAAARALCDSARTKSVPCAVIGG